MHTDNTKRAKYLSLTTLSNELCHTFFFLSSAFQPSFEKAGDHADYRESNRNNRNQKKFGNESNRKKLDVKPSPRNRDRLERFNYVHLPCLFSPSRQVTMAK